MLTRTAATGHNGRVRRLILLAIGVFALLWASAVRTNPVPADAIVAMAGTESCVLKGDHHTGDTGRHWDAPHQTIVPVTSSVWKSAPVHAAFAATPPARIFDRARAGSSADPPARPAPLYLRHTPLLI